MATTQRSKLQHAVQRWKTKAIQRGKLLKQIKKRLNELTSSRDQWKHKAQARQARIIALQRENRQLRQQFTVTEKKPRPAPALCPQSPDHSDVSCPETPNLRQFSGRCQKQ